MKAPYTFCILRYFHDVFTSEFVNVGLVFYSPKQRFLRFDYTSKISRLSGLFPQVDKEHVRSQLRFLGDCFAELAFRIETDLPFDRTIESLTARELAKTILPEDASAFQWSDEGSGLTDSPERALKSLYDRLVASYERSAQPERKEDKDVWTPFQEAFSKTKVLFYLTRVELKYGDFKQSFEHAWKNGSWNLYQPLSFDLIEKRDIVDKAIHWGGRINLLRKADPEFKVYWLVGPPQRSENQKAFQEARTILARDVTGAKEVVNEADAEQFSREVAAKIESGRQT